MTAEPSHRWTGVAFGHVNKATPLPFPAIRRGSTAAWKMGLTYLA